VTYNLTRYYRTKDNSCDILFGFKHCYDGWRAYILTPVDYFGLDDDCHTTHRFYDLENDLFYVCWDPLPDNLEDCKQIAGLWSELTLTYLRTGEDIDGQYQRLYGG